MSKAFIASVSQGSTDCTGVAANQAAADLIAAIVKEMKKEAGFTLPTFDTFSVVKTKPRKALNPLTGEPVKVNAARRSALRQAPTSRRPPNFKLHIGRGRMFARFSDFLTLVRNLVRDCDARA